MKASLWAPNKALPLFMAIYTVQGGYNRAEEEDRLRSTYDCYHGPKSRFHDRRAEINSKPSSLRLLAGTNEFAEDLTGQRLPLNAANWKSETKVFFISVPTGT